VNHSWKLTRLGDVLRSVSRPAPVSPEKTYILVGAHWYAKGLYVKEQKSGTAIQARTLFQIKEGDFVYNRLFAWKGSFAVATKDVDGCFVSNEFPCFVPLDTVDSKFLWFYFSRSSAWSEALGLSSGSTPTSRNRLKEEQFLNMELRLPPVDEQRRVASQVDTLAVKIAEARILKGQAAEETNLLSRASSNGVYRELAEKHGLKRLDNLCDSITDGDHNTPHFIDEGVRFIFVGNVSSGHLHFADCKCVSPEYFSRLTPQRVPKRGDILYSAVGATLGVPAVVETNEPFCFQRHIAILRPQLRLLVPRYAWHMLRSRTVFEKAWSYTTGTAQPTVPLRAIKALEIPAPAVGEQQRIATYLDGLEAKVDDLKTLQSESAAQLDSLMPSILSKAFRGEL
jgi:type I restriction enzyme S subunit